jgi:hydroxyacylglutathione hydrolase
MIVNKLTIKGFSIPEMRRAIRCFMAVQMLYCNIQLKLLSLFYAVPGANNMTVIIDDKDIRIERLILSAYEANCYIVVCQKTSDSLVVDAPADASAIIKAMQDTTPKYILLTHDHYDHTGTLVSLRSRLKVPLAAHTDVSLKSPPEIILNDGDILDLGKLKINILHTPGHTINSLCFKIGKYLIAGDTIFPGGPGKTWAPGDFKQIIKSITEKILTLPDDTAIYPGHGEGTTVKKAKEEYAVFASRSHAADLYGDVTWLSS